jgi:hypothetical protein
MKTLEQRTLVCSLIFSLCILAVVPSNSYAYWHGYRYHHHGWGHGWGWRNPGWRDWGYRQCTPGHFNNWGAWIPRRCW